MRHASDGEHRGQHQPHLEGQDRPEVVTHLGKRGRKRSPVQSGGKNAANTRSGLTVTLGTPAIAARTAPPDDERDRLRDGEATSRCRERRGGGQQAEDQLGSWRAKKGRSSSAASPLPGPSHGALLRAFAPESTIRRRITNAGRTGCAGGTADRSEEKRTGYASVAAHVWRVPERYGLWICPTCCRSFVDEPRPWRTG